MLLIIVSFIFGLILGWILNFVKEQNRSIKGVIQIDPKTKMCRVTILDEHIADSEIDKVTFLVSHDADISREEDAL